MWSLRPKWKNQWPVRRCRWRSAWAKSFLAQWNTGKGEKSFWQSKPMFETICVHFYRTGLSREQVRAIDCKAPGYTTFFYLFLPFLTESLLITTNRFHLSSATTSDGLRYIYRFGILAAEGRLANERVYDNLNEYLSLNTVFQSLNMTFPEIHIREDDRRFWSAIRRQTHLSASEKNQQGPLPETNNIWNTLESHPVSLKIRSRNFKWSDLVNSVCLHWNFVITNLQLDCTP